MTEQTNLSCRFTLSPMSDRFVEIILGAVEKVDTHLIQARTGKLSTVYRGQREYVEDAVKACFIHAYRPRVHMTMEAVYSRGWPGEEELAWPAPSRESAPNAAAVGGVRFPAAAKLTLYPFGGEEELSAVLPRLAGELGVYDSEEPDCLVIGGDIQAVFACVEAANRFLAERAARYALAVTLSVNSPTA